MSEKIPNSPAFKEELQISSFNKHSFDLKLFELPSSNFVVREVPVDYIYKNEDKISMVEVAQDLNSLFDELRIKYEINAPVKFLVADDELGQPTVFTLTEKIKTNKELSFDYVGYRHILERLFNYLKDKYQSGGKLMYDLADREQFVFGTTEDDPSPRWYLADTDPDFIRKSKLDPEFGNPFIDFLESLTDELNWVEAETGEKSPDLQRDINDFMKVLESDMVVLNLKSSNFIPNDQQ